MASVAATVPNKLANVDIQSIIDRVCRGEQQTDIANELGVTCSAISYHLNKDPSIKRIIQDHHQARLDEGHKWLDQSAAERDFDLARVRDLQLRRREWRAQVECPERWGAKQQIDLNVAVKVDHSLKFDLAALLDQVKTVAEIPQEDDGAVRLGEISSPMLTDDTQVVDC